MSNCIYCLDFEHFFTYSTQFMVFIHMTRSLLRNVFLKYFHRLQQVKNTCFKFRNRIFFKFHNVVCTMHVYHVTVYKLVQHLHIRTYTAKLYSDVLVAATTTKEDNVMEQRNVTIRRCLLACGIVFPDDGSHYHRNIKTQLNCISMCIVLDQLADTRKYSVFGERGFRVFLGKVQLLLVSLALTVIELTLNN